MAILAVNAGSSSLKFSLHPLRLGQATSKAWSPVASPKWPGPLPASRAARR